MGLESQQTHTNEDGSGKIDTDDSISESCIGSAAVEWDFREIPELEQQHLIEVKNVAISFEINDDVMSCPSLQAQFDRESSPFDFDLGDTFLPSAAAGHLLHQLLAEAEDVVLKDVNHGVVAGTNTSQLAHDHQRALEAHNVNNSSDADHLAPEALLMNELTYFLTQSDLVDSGSAPTRTLEPAQENYDKACAQVQLELLGDQTILKDPNCIYTAACDIITSSHGGNLSVPFQRNVLNNEDVAVHIAGGRQSESLLESYFANEDLQNVASCSPCDIINNVSGKLVSSHCLQSIDAKNTSDNAQAISNILDELILDLTTASSTSDAALTATDNRQYIESRVGGADHPVANRRRGRKKRATSCNPSSERKRRQKLNERLYTLRAIVPNITKMDKASILSDALTYVSKIRKEIKDIEADISNLQAESAPASNHSIIQDPSPENSGGGDSSITSETLKSDPAPIASHHRPPSSALINYFMEKDVQLEISKMDKQMYHLHLKFSGGEGGFCHVLQRLPLINANITSISFFSNHNQCCIIAIIKVDGWDDLNLSEVEKQIRAIIL